MPYALALMVLCLDTNELKPMSECKRCSHYGGIMNEEMVSCAKIEDKEPKIEAKPVRICLTIARRERGLVCGAPKGICNQKHNPDIVCPFKPVINGSY